MTDWAEYGSVESYVDDNRERLTRVLRHSSDPFARACAWAIIDAGSSGADLEVLRRELETLAEREG